MKLLEGKEEFEIQSKLIDMAEYIGLENFQTKLDFEHISDYPGLNIVITWSINPTNEQKVKLPPPPKKEEK